MYSISSAATDDAFKARDFGRPSDQRTEKLFGLNEIRAWTEIHEIIFFEQHRPWAEKNSNVFIVMSSRDIFNLNELSFKIHLE